MSKIMSDNRRRNMPDNCKNASCLRFRPQVDGISDEETCNLEIRSLKANMDDNFAVRGGITGMSSSSKDELELAIIRVDEGSGNVIQASAVRADALASGRCNHQDSKYTLLSPQEDHPEIERRSKSDASFQHPSKNDKLKHRKGLAGYFACCGIRLHQRSSIRAEGGMKERSQRWTAASETEGHVNLPANTPEENSQESMSDAESWRKAIVPYHCGRSRDSHAPALTQTKSPFATTLQGEDGRGQLLDDGVIDEDGPAAKMGSHTENSINGWNQTEKPNVTRRESVEKVESDGLRGETHEGSLWRGSTVEKFRTHKGLPFPSCSTSALVPLRKSMKKPESTDSSGERMDQTEDTTDRALERDAKKQRAMEQSEREVPHRTCLASLPFLREFQEAVESARLQMRMLAGYLVLKEDIRTTGESHHLDRMQMLARIMKAAGAMESPLPTLFFQKPWHIKHALDACASSIFFKLEQRTMCCEGCRSRRKHKALIFDDDETTEVHFDRYLQGRGRAIEALVGWGMERWSDTLKSMFWSCAAACFRVHTLVTASGCRHAVKVTHPVRGDRFDATAMEAVDVLLEPGSHGQEDARVLFTIFSGFMVKMGLEMVTILSKPQVYVEPKTPGICIV